MSQHIATEWPNALNMLHPTVLRYVAIVWPGLQGAQETTTATVTVTTTVSATVTVTLTVRTCQRYGSRHQTVSLPNEKVSHVFSITFWSQSQVLSPPPPPRRGGGVLRPS